MQNKTFAGKKYISLFAFILFISFNVFAADEASWVIAAEQFSEQNVPSVYKSYTTLIPLMIMQNLSGIQSRLVPAFEQHAQEMQDLADKRVRLVRERSDIIQNNDKLFFQRIPIL
ncbi:hypothetical protein K7I13_00870 [Brucepastera parasyntrophica]|uniref:hypothetical protein n=1 Tax=Brucepastera parasyntrophica TaxID=2880008 RepID=UPI00210BB531|nr:hypothetical protein [Brucepastera parasyntrophica]ULQ59931.1 hypothetical protein K7I13_00870 [Brucepastera parasyntrophica]